MPKRSSKHLDPNEIAAQIVDWVSGEPRGKGKNPAAVALGRLGGQKGGPARAAKLSAQERKKIAQKAARTRWKRK